MMKIRLRAWVEADKKLHMIRIVDFAPDGIPLLIRVADPIQIDEYGNIDWDFSEYREGFIIEHHTGLRDINGVDIFEGDIMEYRLGNGLRRDFVRFEQGMFGIIGPSPMYDDLPLNVALTCVHDARVVGNVHENMNMVGWVSPPIEDSPAEWAKGDR